MTGIGTRTGGGVRVPTSMGIFLTIELNTSFFSVILVPINVSKAINTTE